MNGHGFPALEGNNKRIWLRLDIILLASMQKPILRIWPYWTPNGSFPNHAPEHGAQIFQHKRNSNPYSFHTKLILTSAPSSLKMAEAPMLSEGTIFLLQRRRRSVSDERSFLWNFQPIRVEYSQPSPGSCLDMNNYLGFLVPKALAAVIIHIIYFIRNQILMAAAKSKRL